MHLVIPKTNFYYTTDIEADKVCLLLKEKLIGKNLLEINTLLGEKKVLYYGEFKTNHINLTRQIDSLYSTILQRVLLSSFFHCQKTCPERKDSKRSKKGRFCRWNFQSAKINLPISVEINIFTP